LHLTDKLQYFYYQYATN